MTRFSRANKNRDGEHNGMPEENLSLPFLHPPGEYFTCLFSFSFSPLFFSRSCLKSILIKCKSESSQPSRLFFRVEEFSLLLFFFYFRFSIFCKVFCAFNVKNVRFNFRLRLISARPTLLVIEFVMNSNTDFINGNS